MELIIEKLGGKGVSISRYEGKAVLIPFGVPGDKVLLKNIRDKKSYITGDIKQILTPSPDRVKAPCPYFGSCGGCAHQNMSIENQSFRKDELISEIFRKFSPQKRTPMTPSPLTEGYRNKIHLQCKKIGRRLIMGFYSRDSKKIIEIENCLLCSKEINRLGRAIKERLNYYGTHIRDLIIHESEDGLMATMISSKKKIPHMNRLAGELEREFPHLKGLYLYHNPHAGDIAFMNNAKLDRKTLNSMLIPLKEGYLKTIVADKSFILSPLTFFQVNKGQILNIINKIRSYLTENDSNRQLIDAHAGTGTLSIPLGHHFESVFALELVKHSLFLAEENCRNNQIDNFRFYPGDALEGLKKIPLDTKEKVLLLDPPRGGLTKELGEYISGRLDLKKIIYLSCDPHTQARDLGWICKAGNFVLKEISPFDMFPHTFHIENLCFIEKKPNPRDQGSDSETT